MAAPSCVTSLGLFPCLSNGVKVPAALSPPPWAGVTSVWERFLTADALGPTFSLC